MSIYVLTGDSFVENEEEWRKEKKSTPPYLMVLTSLPNAAICTSGYWKTESDTIVTYDCFTESKEELVQLEKEKTFLYVTALSACLSTPEHSVTFIPLAREVYGVTPDNKTLRDIRFTGGGEISVSKVFPTDTVLSGIDIALNAEKKIHSKIGYFFDLGVRETDTLKKFLYFFLVVEVHTHQVFRTLDYPASFARLNNIPERIQSSATDLLVNYQKDAKNLSQRFLWCSLLRWTEVTDDDISDFKLIKKTRDHIYHGEDVDTKTLPVHQAKKLALNNTSDSFCNYLIFKRESLVW